MEERTYSLSYGKGKLHYRDVGSRVCFCATPKKVLPLPDPEALIHDALDHPIGSAPLEELVKPGCRLGIVVDDITRPTPRRRLLEGVLSRIAGIPGVRVRIILALGTHRTMTEEEIRRDLGEYASIYPVVNISYSDEDRFVQAGVMPDGTPIRVYREVLESDVLLGFGNIVPHIAAGWGGGAKIIMPGVCSKETTDAIHMLSCLEQNVLTTCGNTDNLFRSTMETLARKVGLSFIVNTVIDEDRNLLGVFAGDCVAAHRAGVAFARKVLCPAIPHRADILLVSANPANADFWQGAKPYVFAHYAVKRGGVMVFLLSGGEGLCGGAPAHEATMRKYYDKDEQTLQKAIADGEVTDILGLGEAFIRLQTEGFCHTILVSDGLTEEDAALLGFEKAPNLDAAMARAHGLMGENASIGIIPQGGDLLCMPQDE